MSGKIRYTDEPIGEPKIIRDVLPSPAELAYRDEDVKITITLSRKSVEFFDKHHLDRLVRGVREMKRHIAGTTVAGPTALRMNEAPRPSRATSRTRRP